MSFFYFKKFQKTIYKVPMFGNQLSLEERLLEISKPWLQLKVFNREGYESRLPEHYKHFYWIWKHGEKIPVHSVPERGNFKLAQDKESVVPIRNKPVQVVYPETCNQGLWGGEGVIKGYRHIGRYKGEVAKYWWPSFIMAVLYSEILDQYFEVVVTERALRQIDKHYGLDNYLMKTSYADINSTLGFALKRDMLLALANQTLYPDNPKKRKEITDKYRDFIIPAEEADWIGLTLEEACKKQELLEQKMHNPTPLKHVFRAQLLQYLNEKNNSKELDGSAVEDVQLSQDSKTRSWLQKFYPFGGKSNQ